MNKVNCDKLFGWLFKERNSEALQCLVVFIVYAIPSLLIIKVGSYERNGLEAVPGVCMFAGVIMPLAMPGYLSMCDKKVSMSRAYFYSFVIECVITICCLGFKVYDHSFMNADLLKCMINIPMCLICMSIMYYLIEWLFNKYGKDGEITVT